MKLTEKQYSKLLQAAKNITNNHQQSEDLLHESLVALLEKSEEKIQKIVDDNAVHFYVIRIMLNMWNSSTSSYFYKYRFQKKYIFELFPEYRQQKMSEKCHFITPSVQEERNKAADMFFDDAIDKMEEILSELYWYDRELFKLYKFGSNNGKRWTLNSLAEKTGISRTSIFDTTKRVQNHLIKRLKEEVEPNPVEL